MDADDALAASPYDDVRRALAQAARCSGIVVMTTPGWRRRARRSLSSGAVVEGLVPAVLDDQLGQDDGQRELGSLGAQRVDVARQRRDERAVGRVDDLERQVIAPGGPVALEARCLVVAGADVHRQHGLAQRGGVGQRTQARQIEADDRHDRQVLELVGALVLLGLAERVRAVAARSRRRARHDRIGAARTDRAGTGRARRRTLS